MPKGELKTLHSPSQSSSGEPFLFTDKKDNTYLSWVEKGEWRVFSSPVVISLTAQLARMPANRRNVRCLVMSINYVVNHFNVVGAIPLPVAHFVENKFSLSVENESSG